MKKMIFVAIGAALLSFGIAQAREHDKQDLRKVHEHLDNVERQLHEASAEMMRAREANHFDMGGHGAEVDKKLAEAERIVHEAKEQYWKAVMDAKLF